MRKNLAQALTLILASEGSKPNISTGEPGGASKFGVSVDALSDQRRAHKLSPATIDNVVALTEQQARDFYTERFAAPIRFDDLPGGVDYRLLDIEVNLGPTGGIMALELALGMVPDGKMTEGLLAAARVPHPAVLIASLGAVWIAKKHASPSWDRFAKGWTNRLNAANAAALKMVEAGP